MVSCVANVLASDGPPHIAIIEGQAREGSEVLG